MGGEFFHINSLPTKLTGFEPIGAVNNTNPVNLV